MMLTKLTEMQRRVGLSDILPSGKIDVCSSMWADFKVIRDKGVECSVEAPTSAAGDFKLVLRRSNTVGERLELLSCMDSLHSSIRFSETPIQSHERHMSTHPADVE